MLTDLPGAAFGPPFFFVADFGAPALGGVNVMARSRRFEWDELHALGSSKLVQLTVVLPVIGYLNPVQRLRAPAPRPLRGHGNRARAHQKNTAKALYVATT
jgi:hypothetical protein